MHIRSKSASQETTLTKNLCNIHLSCLPLFIFLSCYAFFLFEHYLNFLSKNKNWINWWYNFQKWTVMFNNVNVQVGKQQWLNTWSCLTKYILQDINYLYLTYSLYTKQIWSTIKQLTKTIKKGPEKGSISWSKIVYFTSKLYLVGVHVYWKSSHCYII